MACLFIAVIYNELLDKLDTTNYYRRVHFLCYDISDERSGECRRDLPAERLGEAPRSRIGHF